jgi:cell division transport system ATP-binding protein
MPPEYPETAASVDAPPKIIQLFGVTKTYSGGVSALKDLSVQVERGDFLFISGSSGAGKTTLLKIIMGVERVTKGQLVVNGRNVTRIPPGELTRLRKETGFVFQDFKLLENRSALENVALALQIHGMPPAEVRRRAYHALRAVGLGDKRDQKPLRLSGGEQQRVAIARALVNNPLILLADEPTGNLDADLSREIMDQFLEIHQRGTTLLVATHDEALPAYCGKNRIVLEKGHLVQGIEAEVHVGL